MFTTQVPFGDHNKSGFSKNTTNMENIDMCSYNSNACLEHKRLSISLTTPNITKIHKYGQRNVSKMRYISAIR
jgi:hypothetical protein